MRREAIGGPGQRIGLIRQVDVEVLDARAATVKPTAAAANTAFFTWASPAAAVPLPRTARRFLYRQRGRTAPDDGRNDDDFMNFRNKVIGTFRLSGNET